MSDSVFSLLRRSLSSTARLLSERPPVEQTTTQEYKSADQGDAAVFDWLSLGEHTAYRPLIASPLLLWKMNLLSVSADGGWLAVAAGWRIMQWKIDGKGRPISPDNPVVHQFSGDINYIHSGWLGCVSAFAACDAMGAVHVIATGEQTRKGEFICRKERWWDNSAWSIAFTERGHPRPAIFVGTNGHCVYQWTIANTTQTEETWKFELTRSIQQHDNNIPCVTVSSCGHYFATSCIDSATRIFRLSNGCLLDYRHITRQWGWTVKFIPASAIMAMNVTFADREKAMADHNISQFRDYHASVATARSIVNAPTADRASAMDMMLRNMFQLINGRSLDGIFHDNGQVDQPPAQRHEEDEEEEDGDYVDYAEEHDEDDMDDEEEEEEQEEEHAFHFSESEQALLGANQTHVQAQAVAQPQTEPPHDDERRVRPRVEAANPPVLTRARLPAAAAVAVAAQGLSGVVVDDDDGERSQSQSVNESSHSMDYDELSENPSLHSDEEPEDLQARIAAYASRMTVEERAAFDAMSRARQKAEVEAYENMRERRDREDASASQAEPPLTDFLLYADKSSLFLLTPSLSPVACALGVSKGTLARIHDSDRDRIIFVEWLPELSIIAVASNAAHSFRLYRIVRYACGRYRIEKECSLPIVREISFVADESTDEPGSILGIRLSRCHPSLAVPQALLSWRIHVLYSTGVMRLFEVTASEQMQQRKYNIAEMIL